MELRGGKFQFKTFGNMHHPNNWLLRYFFPNYVSTKGGPLIAPSLHSTIYTKYSCSSHCTMYIIECHSLIVRFLRNIPTFFHVCEKNHYLVLLPTYIFLESNTEATILLQVSHRPKFMHTYAALLHSCKGLQNCDNDLLYCLCLTFDLFILTCKVTHLQVTKNHNC